jgi:hypothetical protein
MAREPYRPLFWAKAQNLIFKQNWPRSKPEQAKAKRRDLTDRLGQPGACPRWPHHEPLFVQNKRFLCHPSTTIDVEALKTYTSGLIFIAVGPKRAHVLEKKKEKQLLVRTSGA